MYRQEHVVPSKLITPLAAWYLERNVLFYSGLEGPYPHHCVPFWLWYFKGDLGNLGVGASEQRRRDSSSFRLSNIERVGKA